jgi:sugar phosphate isomerase/epimerase
MIVSKFVLCAAPMTNFGFREHVEAAASAGWDAISIDALGYQRAQDEGLSAADLNAILDDNGVTVDEIEVCHEWPLFEPGSEMSTADLAANCSCAGICASRHILLDLAETLHAPTLIAVHRNDVLPLDATIERFAGLCDVAAEHGVRVGLEYAPHTAIRDVSEAWDVVRISGRANAGLVIDTRHHLGLGGNDAILRGVPAEQVFVIQVNDGTFYPPGTTREQALSIREQLTEGLLPGEGELDVIGTLHTLSEMGVRAPTGVETRKQTWKDLAAEDIAKRLRVALDQVLSLAG